MRQVQAKASVGLVVMNGERVMERWELWRMKYRERRYLENLSKDELIVRLRDLISNVTMLTDTGQVGVLTPDKDEAYWMGRFTDVDEEMRLRGLVLPDGALAGCKVPNPTWPRPAVSVVRQLTPGRFLVKYGKLKHLKDTVERGAIRLAPASAYKDPSLNAAIRDDELRMIYYGLKSEVTLEVKDPVTGASKGKLTPLSDLEYHDEFPFDYYVYCTANMFAPRLFGDFEADACLIIHNPDEFSRRLLSCAEQQLKDWMVFRAAVTYYDPYNVRDKVGKSAVRPADDPPVMPFAKHFRYTYQGEFRFAWIKKNPGKLEPLFLTLGDLRDIADLVG